MPDRFMRRLELLLAGCLLLGACAGRPVRGVPSHYAQDSLSARCRVNPVYCATATGREVATGPVQTVGTAVASTGVVVAALDEATKPSIKSALEQCADMARTEVLLSHSGTFEGLVPNARECKQMTVDAKGRSVTWAMRLGLEMHEAAMKCAEAKLSEMNLRFSLKQRYRFDRETGEKSLISAKEKEALLRQGGEELKGTLEPDVVIHDGDPLQVQAVYDFKFKCVNFDEYPEWRRYPPGHRYEGRLQGDVYKEAFGPEVHPIGPRKGAFW
ncbi:hypothetical protein [Archangium lipolyticum]|uniref:hypothetical protein n=1 Tax=Archangium lipolyticum TaxID=2970465 RepID=UPI00214A1075|nr:hypothetical protein [Archangium lipolyticum]